MNNHLGRTIRKHRERRGSSLHELATDAGTTKSYLWDLESGRSQNPTVDTLMRLAIALDLAPTALFLVAASDWTGRKSGPANIIPLMRQA